MGSRKDVVRVIVGTALLALVAAVLTFSRQIVAYYHVQQLRRENPDLGIVPKPLLDCSINPERGITISRFGYTFELPWKDVDQVRDYTSIAGIVFKSGPVVVFFSPKEQPDLVTAMQGRRDVRDVFGADAMASNYRLRKAILNITPDAVSPFMPAKDAVRNAILLGLKSIDAANTKTGLFSVEAPGMRGFQQGDPSLKPDRVILELFDDKDRKFEFTLSSREGSQASLTQADVNRIISSLHPDSQPSLAPADRAARPNSRPLLQIPHCAQ